MKKTQKTATSWLHPSVVRLSRVHFLYVALFTVQTVVYDTWKLITPFAVLNRWFLAGGLLAVTVIVWYLAKYTVKGTNGLKALVSALILADIAAASFNVYTQRGMASRAVALYAVPIAVSAVLQSRVALLATATLSMAAYTTTALSYFVLNFNEGYKIELYGEVGFYSLMFFVLAGILWTVIRARKMKN
ncbi:MAG TPA: hypothetical protein VLG25_01910 [Patescibacteria group bacterium]|nr:hypothetical protein [Patescibacteria group bacterium]